MRLIRIPLGVLFALGLVAIIACGGPDEEDSNQFREDVIACEEAVAKLKECCGARLTKGIACKYYYAVYRGCGGDPLVTETNVDLRDSFFCIRGSTCEVILKRNACTAETFDALEQC